MSILFLESRLCHLLSQDHENSSNQIARFEIWEISRTIEQKFIPALRNIIGRSNTNYNRNCNDGLAKSILRSFKTIDICRMILLQCNVQISNNVTYLYKSD